VWENVGINNTGLSSLLPHLRPVHSTMSTPQFEDALESKTFRGKMPGPPVFATKLEEREFLKFRLAQALRIFGSSGFVSKG
jgi:hypothetical protein